MDGFDVLDVKRGNTLEFLESYDENWWKMRSVDTGKVGLVAVKYMKEVKQGAKSDIDMASFVRALNCLCLFQTYPVLCSFQFSFIFKDEMLTSITK